jgi:iron-sulfur cluster assembly protein
MRLTDAAAERIKAVMAKAERPIVAVRVGVKNGGCAGMAYTMEYAEKINPLDEVLEDKGVRVLIDPKAVMFLLGTEMDYKIDKLSAQFVFNRRRGVAAEQISPRPSTFAESPRRDRRRQSGSEHLIQRLKGDKLRRFSGGGVRLRGATPLFLDG